MDEGGTYHRAIRTLSPSNGTGHVYVDEGRYLACAMLQATGRYSYTYVEVKKEEITSIRKIFLLLIPIDTFEEWETGIE